jgi:hypothetical protein
MPLRIGPSRAGSIGGSRRASRARYHVLALAIDGALGLAIRLGFRARTVGGVGPALVRGATTGRAHCCWTTRLTTTVVRTGSWRTSTGGRAPRSRRGDVDSPEASHRSSTSPRVTGSATSCPTAPTRGRRRKPVGHRDKTSGGEMPAKIGAPGFEPGTSPTRTARATRLRHAPKFEQSSWELRRRP